MDREKKVDEIIEVISEIILNYLSENTEESKRPTRTCIEK